MAMFCLFSVYFYFWRGFKNNLRNCKSLSEVKKNLKSGPYPNYGWEFPGRNSGNILERPRKRSQSVSWNSPREYGWDAPNPIIQGI